MLEWLAIPFSRGYSRPRDQTQVSCTAESLLSEPPRKPPDQCLIWISNRCLRLIMSKTECLFFPQNFSSPQSSPFQKNYHTSCQFLGWESRIHGFLTPLSLILHIKSFRASTDFIFRMIHIWPVLTSSMDQMQTAISAHPDYSTALEILLLPRLTTL